MINPTAQRVVFFDLDGTLHQQDMFGCFLSYLLAHLPLNIVLVIPVLPVVALGLLVKGRSARWPMSLLLWSITFGHSEAKLQALQAAFAAVFRQRVRRFPHVLARLDDYLAPGCPGVAYYRLAGVAGGKCLPRCGFLAPGAAYRQPYAPALRRLGADPALSGP